MASWSEVELGRPLSFPHAPPSVATPAETSAQTEGSHNVKSPASDNSHLDAGRAQPSPYAQASPIARQSSGPGQSESATHSHASPDPPASSPIAVITSGRSRESFSSTATRAEQPDDLASGGAKGKTREQAEEELGEPSDAHIANAGLVGASAAGAGKAGTAFLARGGDRLPSRWQEVEAPQKYGFWSNELKKERWAATKKGLMIFPFITFWLWVCLPFFWGSTYQLLNFLPNLTVELVSFDKDPSSFLNTPMADLVLMEQALPPTSPHLGWVTKPASEYPNGLSDVEARVIGQDAWAVVVINANATTAWRTALENGDASYDPNGAIGVYFASARFYQVTLLYIQQIIEGNLANPLTKANSAAFQSFLQGATGNAAALTTASRVPQALSGAFGYTINDIRSIPNGEWASAAPMEASLIYFVIFAFYIALFGAISRMKSGMNDKLTFEGMLGLRFGWSLLAYFFLSLWQTLVVRAFQVDLTRYLGRAGLVTFWALNYVTLIAGGWAMETVLSIVGPQLLPLFLILWLITSSFYPLELMSRFYRFLRWGIFMHNVEGFKIIAFGTNYVRRLGYHFGILFAVIGVELIGLPLAIFYERWSLDRGKRKAKAKAKEEKDKGEKQGA